MVAVKLIYNPYSLKTVLMIKTSAGETVVTQDSSLAFIFDKSMHKWLEPSGAWNGFFAELSDAVGDNRLKISFVGTADDFKDLSLAATGCKENIELVYLSGVDDQNHAGDRQKLQDLLNFLNTPLASDVDDFIVELRPALQQIFSEKIKMKIVTTVQNLPVREIFSKIAANPNIEFVTNDPGQKLVRALLTALFDMDLSMTLFVFDFEAISSDAAAATLSRITRIIGQDEFAHTVYENLFFVCTDSERLDNFNCAERVKNILSSCGFDRPELFMISGVFAGLLRKKNFSDKNFVVFRELLSATDCKNFLYAPISSRLKAHYADRIARCREILEECTARTRFRNRRAFEDPVDDEQRRNDALNEIALINSNLLALEQTILTHAERRVLPIAIRKIYLSVKKNIVSTEGDIDKKISETSDSLQKLRKRIATLRPRPEVNPYEDFFGAANALRFDSIKFECLARKLSERLMLIKAPDAERAVEKNLVGSTENYLKLNDAKTYSQTLKAFMKKTLTEFADEWCTLFKDQLLMLAGNAVARLKTAEQSPFQDLTADFEKIIGDKNFDIVAVKVELYVVLSYEKAGKQYDFVEYVPVDKIFDEYREQVEKLLKRRLRELKTAAANFVVNFRVQAETNLNRPTATRATEHEIQQLEQAVVSKEKRLAAYKRSLNTLKNFDKQLDRLIEISS